MKLAELVLDGIFPPTCIGCSGEGDWLCLDCVKTVPLMEEVLAPTESPVKRVLAISSYQDPLVGGLIRSLKYQRAVCLEDEALRAVLQRFALEIDFLSTLQASPTMIVPLAMDPERERVRGIDHALHIAQLVQSVLFPEIPVVQALVRTKTVRANATLGSLEERKTNVEGVFACSRDVSDQSILLVDDVYTTGATMAEAAALVEGRGAALVQGCVLACSGPVLG